MSNLSAVFEVLSKNSADVEDIVNRFGGVANFIKASPSLFRIWRTVADNLKNADPEVTADRFEKTLYYNEQTKERVKAFQKAHGLEVDGIVGNATWSQVEKLLKG